MEWCEGVYSYLKELIGDKNQYVTWFLVFVGWYISYRFIKWQSRDNKNQACSERKITNHNDSVKLFKEKLASFESIAIDFWSTQKADEPDPQLVLMKIASNLKLITEMAREIERFDGKVYPSDSFKTLRRFTTNDVELSNRPLKLKSNQIATIRSTCGKLRKLYVLKE
ncbi:hypothetical protein PTR91_03100 [Serratia bockelmannii]|uniref:hypothetical protein n=1 Tax=Serratia TaxID=613 RepID=UPI00313EBA78